MLGVSSDLRTCWKGEISCVMDTNGFYGLSSSPETDV